MDALRDIIVPAVVIILVLSGTFGLVLWLTRRVIEPQLKLQDRLLVVLEKLIEAVHDLSRAVRNERRLE